MLNIIGQVFTPAWPTGTYTRTHYVWLAMLVAAGTWLRFWGLGNVGLYGDEETMAMPAMAILKQGLPYLPSGLLYARAPVQTYLMAASAWIFGESEWAFRFPSALVGSLTALAVFFPGRRFLTPAYNLALVATIAFLPDLITDSQTARMYIFFVTLLAVFAACIFRWEKDQRLLSLVLALLAWAGALLFHELSAFAALLFLFPGLSRESWRQLFQGAAAIGVSGLLYWLMGRWIEANHPETVARLADDVVVESLSSFQVLLSESAWLVLATIVLTALFAVIAAARAARGSWRLRVPIAIIALAILSMCLLHYHIGGILFIVGCLIWLRTPELSRRWLVGAMVLVAAITVAHLSVLAASSAYQGREIVGALVGQPSVWPVIRFLSYNPVSALVYGLALLIALRALARFERIPMHFLFFAMAVWAPLFAMGIFAWDIPPRYAEGQLVYYLICVVAGLAYSFEQQRFRLSALNSPAWRAACLGVAVAALVNPVTLARTVNRDYTDNPDHKGAAEFILSLSLAPDDIVIAEDVLQQTYYLGHVDYWLHPIDDAETFVVERDDGLFDRYTDTLLLGRGEQLASVLDSSEGDVYIIGSGEDFVDGRRSYRTLGISEVLESGRLEQVFLGRDGKTVIWKLRK